MTYIVTSHWVSQWRIGDLRPIVIEVLPVGTAALYCKSDGQQIYNTKFLPTLNIITFKLVKPSRGGDAVVIATL